MNWRLKVLGQNLLGLVPGNFAFAVNNWVNARVRGEPLDRFDVAARVRKGLDNLEFLRVATGAAVTGARVLELGTGWLGIDPVLFFVLGADRIITVDHYRHLTPDRWRRLIGVMGATASVRDAIVRSGLAPSAVVEARLAELRAVAADQPPWTNLLSALRTEYHITPSARTSGLRVDPSSIDIVYTESVLQRIPEADLRETIHDISTRLMTPRAAYYHRINPMDVNGHLDRSRWYFDYLRYSDAFFRVVYSGKLNSQNRLRESDFLDLFESSGLTVSRVTSTLVRADAERLGRIRLAPRFRGKAPEDLAVFRSQIAGRKRAAGTPPPAPEWERIYTSGYTAAD